MTADRLTTLPLLVSYRRDLTNPLRPWVSRLASMGIPCGTKPIGEEADATRTHTARG